MKKTKKNKPIPKSKGKGKVLVIHGPNLHLLGKRETNIYGKFTLPQINNQLKDKAKKAGVQIKIMQSNSESQIIDAVTKADYNFLIINPAGYTHTSVAIRDAILGINKPAIEVHISNIHKREEFRQKSLVSDVVVGVITGLGANSYLLAMEAAIHYIRNQLS